MLLTRISVLSLLFGLFVLPMAPAQSDWNLRKEADGIKVYTQKVAGSKLAAFKGVVTVNASINQLVESLKDVGNYDAWVPDCEVAALHHRQGNQQVHYMEIAAPFPVSNRDSYSRYTYQKEAGQATVTIESLPDFGPPKAGIVRIPYANGFWRFEAISPASTRVTYQVHADPGGSTPAWLANAAVVDNPFETLVNLRAEVE
jgi:ribosome-associated toxin RatA of RatAB toxin-antitoxin module